VFRELYDHMNWADAVVWRAVLATPAAADDKRIRDLLFHLHMVQRSFLTVWREQPLDYRPEWSGPLPELAGWGRQYHDEVPMFVDGVQEGALERPMIMPWAERFRKSAHPTTLRETLLQVPMHSTYHRGQINARLREIGGEPPLTDYSAWLWRGRPAAEWPS
jgi:uncharacterized damage-inducible protein DinB